MKAKMISKKLLLNKQTIINLKDDELNSVKGGWPLTSYNHIYDCYTECMTGICCNNVDTEPTNPS